MNCRLSLAILAASALFAAPAAAHYVVIPASKVGAQTVALQGVTWRCGDEGCTAGETSSRPEIVCAAFAKKIGAVLSFAAGNRALDAAALEKCNARAKS